MFKIPVKALSQNLAWAGKRYRTTKYKDYEKLLYDYFRTLDLPKIEEKEPFYFFLEFATTARQDLSNNLKLFEDVLCKYLNVNDRNTMAIFCRKIIVKKNDEFIRFGIFASEYDLLYFLRAEV